MVIYSFRLFFNYDKLVIYGAKGCVRLPLFAEALSPAASTDLPTALPRRSQHIREEGHFKGGCNILEPRAYIDPLSTWGDSMAGPHSLLYPSYSK